MRTTVILLWIFAGLGNTRLLAASLSTNDLIAIHGAASNSVITLQGLVTPRNYRLLGFYTVGEVTNATNGVPFPIYTVPLEKLTNYDIANGFAALLVPNPQLSPPPVTRVIVPVLVETNVKTAIIMWRKSGTSTSWNSLDWGYHKLMRDIVATSSAIPSGEIKMGTSPFVVEIPLFDVWLVGYFNSQNKIVLRSTMDVRRLGILVLEEKAIVSAGAIQQLSNEAKRYHGTPN